MRKLLNIQKKIQKKLTGQILSPPFRGTASVLIGTFGRGVRGGLTLLLLLSFALITNLREVSAADTVPRRLNYQGRLMDTSDNLLTGTYYLCFTIWDDPAAGSQVWPAGTPSVTTITTSNGVFSAEIGEADTLDLDFDAYDYYLQLYVNDSASCTVGGETLSPRQHMTSAAYSINADMLDGLDAATSGADAHILATDSSGNVQVSSILGVGYNPATITGVAAFNGSVGIGSSSPGSTLDVVGIVRANEYEVDSNVSTANPFIDVDGTTSSNKIIDFTPVHAPSSSSSIFNFVPIITPGGSTSYIYGFDATPNINGSLSLASAGNYRSRFNDGGGYSGVITDFYHFRAEGTYSFSPGDITNAYGFATGDLTDEATNNYGLYTNLNVGSNTNFQIYAAGTAVSYFGGEVGVGTNIPEEDLTVANHIQLGITDGTRYIYFDNGTGNNAGLRYNHTDDKVQFSNDGTTWADIISTSSVYWAKSGTDLSPSTAGDDVLLNAGESLTISDMTLGSVIFAGTGGLLSQDNANLFWDNSLNYLGIGTNSPSARLHVSDGSSDLFTVGDTQINAYVPTSFNTSGDVEIGYNLYFSNPTASYITSASPLYIEAGDAFSNEDLILRSAGGGDVVVGSGTTYFKSDGKVGIGTVNPASHSVLHLVGGFVNEVSAGEYIRTTFANDYAYIQAGQDGSDAGANLRITRMLSTSNLDNLQIYADDTYFTGNVGIGAVSPLGQFEVRMGTETDTNIGYFNQASGNPVSNNYIKWYSGWGPVEGGITGSSTGGWNSNIWTTQFLTLGAGGKGNQHLFINTGGDVGIGIDPTVTMATGDNLLIDGNFYRTAHENGFLVGGYNNIGSNSTNSNPIFTIGSSYIPASTTLGSMYGIGYTHENASFIDDNTDSWGMYVASNGVANVWLAASNGGESYFNAGNVAIGTTDPSELLQIGLDATDPTILLESRSDGTADDQAAGIEFGESTAARGSIWYTGDGYMHIGMNNRAREHMRFQYSSTTTWMYGTTYISALNMDGNITMDDFSVVDMTYLDVNPGVGNGLRFWSGDSYKISMGNTAEYQYGPVTDYSIKTNMSNTAGRGWTWGVTGSTPVGALNKDGEFQVEDRVIAGPTIYSTGPNSQIHAKNGPTYYGEFGPLNSSYTHIRTNTLAGFYFYQNVYLSSVPSAGANTALCWDGSGASIIGDCPGAPGDIAEYYRIGDPGVTFGNIVSVTKGDLYSLKNSTKQDNILGVISTNPYEVFGDTIGENERIALALVGRVPLKVNLENGAIKKGDKIAVSSQAGIGTKANKAGQVVGVALEDYDGTHKISEGSDEIIDQFRDDIKTLEDQLKVLVADQDAGERQERYEKIANLKKKIQLIENGLAKGQGYIMVFLDLSWSEPDDYSAKIEQIISDHDAGLLGSNGGVASLPTELNLQSLNSQVGTFSQLRADTFNIGNGKLTVDALGNVTSLGIITANKLVTNELEVQKLIAWKDQDLELQLAQDKDFILKDSEGKEVFRVTSEGKLAFAERQDEEGNVLSSSVGEGIIEVGETEILIENSLIAEGSKIFISPRTLIDQQIVVTEKYVEKKMDLDGDGIKEPFTGFKAAIKSEEEVEVGFDYWIVN